MFPKDLRVWVYISGIRLGLAPMSIMKMRSGSSPSTDIVVMREAENFFGFITETLHSLPLVPSPESLSPDVSCSGSLEIRSLASRSSASFSKNYSMNYCIDIFRHSSISFTSYILTITALFEVPFVSYSCLIPTFTTS